MGNLMVQFLPRRRSGLAQNAVSSGCPILLFLLFRFAAGHLLPPMFVCDVSSIRAGISDLVFLFATTEATGRRFFFDLIIFRRVHVWFGLGHVRHFTIDVIFFLTAVQFRQCSSFFTGFSLFGSLFASFLLVGFLVDDLKLWLFFKARQVGTAWQLLGTASQQPATYIRRLFSRLFVVVAPVGDAV